nr:RNA-directed DNA polymerase, eukaryota, reverse transcriptase zinc-binding domain protein [Tanacetum cinerariifolium]GEZ53752.1 RNA-directed DNA polymerase, eukaryota, reverse transcriptase zinc-binding domain protein [Tanacetum cinerariifolium]GEZ61445.1 RNA-directed DNA polymerase, eukaryota, reverse transcriptase zinc-binding domain protein [Tanacetum cinerariifolium]
IDAHKTHTSSNWSAIVRELHSLKDKGFDFWSHCKKRIGNGLDTSFWYDCWIDDSALHIKFPRLFALELDKDISVAGKMNSQNRGGGEYGFLDFFEVKKTSSLERADWHANLLCDEKFGTFDARLRGLDKRKERKECLQEDFNRRNKYFQVTKVLVVQMHFHIIVKDKRTMDMTIDQQVALDKALVPHASRLRIGKSNFRLRSDITSKESTLQVVYDVLRLTPFYKAFLVTADVPEIYMQEFWTTVTVHHHSIRFKMNNKKRIVNLEYFREMLHICLRIPNQTFDELLFKEEILAFLRYLGHGEEIKKITDVNINKLHQP